MRVSCLLATVVVLRLWPTLAVADEPWYRSYESGLRAAAKGQWDEVERHMEAALRQRPAQGRNVLAYGVTTISRYVPRFYLGLAFHHQEKFEAALEQWRLLDTAGILKPGDPEAIRMAELRPEATRRAADKPPVPAVASATMAPAAEAGPGPAPRPTNAEAERSASQKEATAGSEAVRPSPAMPSVSASVPVGNDPAVESDTTPQKTPGRAMATSSSASPPVAANGSDAERAALHAFYSGRYQTAVDVFRALVAQPRPEARHVFHLACSTAALALLDDDNELLLEAEARFAEAKRRQRWLRCDDPTLSPKIRDVCGKALARGAR